MKKQFLVALGITLLLPVLAEAGTRPTPSDFAYEKQVVLPEGSTGKAVQIPFDTEILTAVDERFGNFGIYTKSNEEVPFGIFYENFERVNDATIVNVSSAKRGKVVHLMDGNPITPFQFDEREDKNEASWVLIDLGQEKPLNRVEIFAPETPAIKSLEIEAGVTQDSLKSVISKRPFEWRTEMNTNPVRFVKINLWGIGVTVEDIRLTTSRNGFAYITAPEETVKILYGGNTADYLKFEERFGEEQPRVISAQLTKQTWNGIFHTDVDKDGFENDVDTCPFISNPDQKDSDEDRVGDACDNAKKVKNYNQSDLDADGVGDIVDNCKLKKNPDQADRDDDGFGDACDNAHATPSSDNPVEEVVNTLTETPKRKGLLGAALGLIALGIVLWVGLRKKK